MKRITRRAFVKVGLATPLIVGGGCLSVGLKEALAQARKTNKPLLTPENLNRLFADEEANKALAAEAIRDLKGFVRRRFTLTALQSRRLDRLSRLDIAKLRDALKLVAARGGSITVSFPVDDGDAVRSMGQGFVAAAPFSYKVDVSVKTPVASAEVHVEVT